VFDETVGVITAIGAVATAVAVVVGVRQLRLSKQLAQTAFEDELAREYRTIVGNLPVEAFYVGARLEMNESTWRTFYAYVDLSNKQLWLAKQNRIGPTTAEHWEEAIRANLELPAFRSAWAEIAQHVQAGSFETLREVVPPDPLPERTRG